MKVKLYDMQVSPPKIETVFKDGKSVDCWLLVEFSKSENPDHHGPDGVAALFLLRWYNNRLDI